MTTTSYSTSNMAGVDVNATFTPASSTTQWGYADNPPFAVGEQAVGTDGSGWVYVLASAAIALGDTCTITSAYAARGITTTLGAFGNLCGTAQVAIASGSYGWLQTKGTVQHLRVAASCLPNVQLATTATAGILDDATTSGGWKISGAKTLATNTLASAGTVGKTAVLNSPIVTTIY